MKFVEPSHFTDPDAAARKLLKIANATEPAQDGRIYIELVDAAFLKAGGTAEQFRDGIKRAVDKGWMVRHESGTYVKLASFVFFCSGVSLRLGVDFFADLAIWPPGSLEKLSIGVDSWTIRKGVRRGKAALSSSIKCLENGEATFPTEISLVTRRPQYTPFERTEHTNQGRSPQNLHGVQATAIRCSTSLQSSPYERLRYFSITEWRSVWTLIEAIRSPSVVQAHENNCGDRR
jgi:hypothetical protein